MPRRARRDIFPDAKVILCRWHSDIIFAVYTREANITRQKAEYHCVAIPLAVRRILLKKALAIASAFFMAAEEGFEPSQAESESAVLPLHNSAIFNLSTCSAVNIIYYIRMQRTCQYLFSKNIRSFAKKEQ